MMPGYHAVRLPPDPRRETVWRSLWRFHFSRLVSPEACVLDLGSGYGSFINHVVARRRIALDVWPDFKGFLAPGVEAVVGRVTALDFLEDHSVDLAFASNLFEHLPQSDLCSVLAILRRKLTPAGQIALLQPNYRYAFREYFDDYTHVTVYSHTSLGDLLVANGYELIDVRPRFLPLTVKSCFPVSTWLIRCYLVSPFKPFGKQMLVRARPRP